MEMIKNGNFEFVGEIYPDICDRLLEAEQKVFIDVRSAGDILRLVLETWTKNLIKEYWPDMERANLAKTISELRKREILPKVEKVNYEYISWMGEKRENNWAHLWREFGNSCHHDKSELTEREFNEPADSFENLLTVLEIAFEAFKADYIRKKGENALIGEFDPGIMPIGEHRVIRTMVPVDAVVSHCEREYETCSYNDMGRIDKYGIVRVFRKNTGEGIPLQLRDVEAFKEASDEAGIQFDGNVQIEILSSMRSKTSGFYVAIYKFSQQPMRLTQSLLEKMNMDERKMLCLQIARRMERFHSLSTPIYHRNLSYDSIFICLNKKGEYEVSVIKLDCAKMDSVEYGTVIQNVRDRQQMISERKVLKYMAPEVRRMMQNPTLSVDWGKSDIYSLGVLFCDILGQKIDVIPVQPMQLQRSGVAVAFVQLLMKMCNANVAVRPSVKQVVEQLEGLV